MLKALNSIIYGDRKTITTGLICKLYLNKDKSKSIDIQLYENTTCKDLLNNFKNIIEGSISNIDKETQEFKFVLKDITNQYNEFILKDNFFIFNYLMNEKYELFYLPFYKKKAYTISLALKDKNSFQHPDIQENPQFEPLQEQLIKQDNAFKYSKKEKKYVKVKIYLHRDIFVIEKIKSKKESIIPLSSISDIKEVYDKSFDTGYSTMMISSKYSSEKTKTYYIAFDSNKFDIWFSIINNQLHQFTDTFSFMKICKDLNDLNRKKTSLVIQIVNKLTNIKGILSLNFSKNIFYEFYDNKNIKDIYDFLLLYQKNVYKKDYLAAEQNLEKIIKILEENKDIKIEVKNKNFLETLKIYYEKIKEINEKGNEINNINNKKDDNNNKKEKKPIKLIDEGFLYSVIDNIIIKYFEPKFNEIINSEQKTEFYNKIMKHVLKDQNKEDNDFYDINSLIDELIIDKK